mgnify:CR=1 FL=1
MKCCKKELTNPDIVDGTAYFVCPECGDVREVEDYRIYTSEEALNLFKEKYGFTLPEEYIKLSESEEKKVVKLPPCKDEDLEYYFGDGFYEIGTLASVDPNSEYSIYSSISSGREWGLPKTYVPLEGDGHTWLALDYGDSLTEPKVIVTETDKGNSLVVANTFNEFVSNLLQYEEVYDLDGNVIYSE